MQAATYIGNDCEVDVDCGDTCVKSLFFKYEVATYPAMFPPSLSAVLRRVVDLGCM